MKHPISTSSFVLFLWLAVFAASATAADRVQPGQWETTIEAGGVSHVMKSCVTPAEAQGMNGNDSVLRDGIEKATAGTGCKVLAVKASGNQVTVTSQCLVGTKTETNTGTTTYRGGSYDAENSNGTKVRAKRVGACP